MDYDDTNDHNDTPGGGGGMDIDDNNKNNDETTKLLSNNWISLTQQVADTIDCTVRTEKIFWNEGKCRPDGRLFYEARSITRLQQGILTKPHAYGSSLVCIQDTILIIAAVSLLIGQPTITTTLNTNTNAVGVSSTAATNSTTSPSRSSNSGSNGGYGDIVISITNTSNMNDDVSILQSLLQRTICNPTIIDLKQLVLVHNQSAYRLLINLQLFGTTMGITLFDSCLLACVSALLDTDLPKVECMEKYNGKFYLPDTTTLSSSTTTSTACDNNYYYTKFQMPIIPISLSAGMYHNINTKSKSWIVDPSLDEYNTLQGNRTIVIVNATAAAISSQTTSTTTSSTDSDDNDCILGIESSSSSSSNSISMTDLALLMKMTIERGKEIYELLMNLK